MKTLKPWALSAFLSVLPACGQQIVEFRNPDGGKSDTGIPDRPNDDGVGPDVGIPVDTLVSDSAKPDTDRGEATNNDGSRVIDVPMVDDSKTETPSLDASTIDVAIIDTSSLDGITLDSNAIVKPAP